MTERKSWDEYFLDLADMVATRSTCSRLSVGAVVTRLNRIQSTGFNGAASGAPHCVHTDDSRCKVSIHAEENALTSLETCLGSTLYLTHSPCFECAQKIGHYGIVKVVFRNQYGSDAGIEWLKDRGVEIIGASL